LIDIGKNAVAAKSNKGTHKFDVFHHRVTLNERSERRKNLK
jgi:hypothetical protein